MADWNWLWVAGQLGVSYLFYQWWKSNDTFLAVLEVAPEIDIDDLKQFSSLTTTVDYATVYGLVQTNDAKPQSVIKSQFVTDCIGVIHRLIIRERKLEKLTTTWAETKRIISNTMRHVSFRLVTPKGNFIRIDKPLDFTQIEDQLEVTHVKLDSNLSSNLDRFVGVFLGNVSTGIETREEMLLTNVPLTGLGRLEKRAGVWFLVPHKEWGGILTRSSRSEIVSSYRSKASFARILGIAFGLTAVLTASYFVYQYYVRRQRRINRLPPPTRPITPAVTNAVDNNNQPARIQCIICLENEVIYSLQPCSHIGLCYTCAQTLQSRHSEQELCPICRTPIEQYQRVFLP